MTKEELRLLLSELGIDAKHYMTRGSSHIPSLRLEVLQNFVTTFMTPPSLVLQKIFPSSKSPSSTILWESKRGGRGMTPFVPPGAPAPQTAPFGFAQHQAEAAYWKEKMPFDEEFLNNLRKPGTEITHQSAKETLAENLADLSNRSDRRKEWMFAQMLTGGEFTYAVKEGYQVSVDYQIPAGNLVTLAGNYRWGETSANIIGDIRDAKKKVANECGGRIDTAMFNSDVLAMLADDTTIRQLLQKNYFGDGSLLGSGGDLSQIIEANAKVIGNLLDIDNFVLYDEQYEIRAWLTAAVTQGVTSWWTVDSTADFEAGETLRINDQSAGTYEERIILSVDAATSRIQVAGAPDQSYKAGEDFVTMVKYFIPSDKFIMFASKVDGKAIAGYKEAPFGVGRHYGQYTDKHDDWDPEVTWIRVQDKGLPVLYQRDALYILDVVTTAGEAATTTTTTSSSSTTTTS